MAPELAYDLLERKDEETRRILENVIFFLVPCFNPDGNIMVAETGTTRPRERKRRLGPAGLFNKYVGHDNNRDAFQINMPESQYIGPADLREWVPQALRGSPSPVFLRPASICRPTRSRCARGSIRCCARDRLERRTYGRPRGRGGDVRRPQRGQLSGVGIPRVQLDDHAAQHRGHADRVGASKDGDADLRRPGQLKGSGRGLPAYIPRPTSPIPGRALVAAAGDRVERQKIAAWAVLDLQRGTRKPCCGMPIGWLPGRPLAAPPVNPPPTHSPASTIH